MATTLDKVLINFQWRIEAIDATSTISGKRFFRFDPRDLGRTESGGLERGFFVTWLGSEPQQAVTDQWQWVCSHRFMIEVMYAPIRGWQESHELVLSDRWDLIKALRDDSLYVGFSDDNSTTDLDLIDRYFEGDGLDIEPDAEVFIYRQNWRCTVRETR